MSDPTDHPQLASAWRVLGLVAGAVVVTDVIYLVVCILIVYVMPWEDGYSGFVFADGAEPPEVLGLVRIALLGVSLPLVAAALWVRGVVKRRASASPALSQMPLPDTPEGKALPRLMLATLVSMAVAEAPGIFGLVTFLIMGGFAWLGAFLGISFASKVVLFPRWMEVEEMVEEERLRKDF